MGKLASGRQSLVVGAVCLAVLFLWPRLGAMGAKVPSSLVAVIVGMTMVPLIGMNVSTIGDLYTINAGLPELHVPQLSNRFAARPASQRRRRRKKGRWLGATRLQKAVEHNDARPPKKGVFLGRSTFALYN